MMRGNTIRHLAKCEAAWPAALRLQQFGVAEITIAVSLPERPASKLIRQWASEGRVRQIAGGPRGKPRMIFEIVPEQEVKAAPQIGDAFDQMWLTMRKFPSFSPPDLKAHCSIAVSIEEARAYCRTLLAANYLKVVVKALPGKKEAVYRLINATGPRAPRKRRVMCIVDENHGTVLPMLEDGQ